MRYLLAEMLLYLLVTAALGAVVGWLARGLSAARRERSQEQVWRRKLRESDARAGRLKNQLAEAGLVEERLREELRQVAPGDGAGAPGIDELQAELARRDKKIEVLKLQVAGSEAALSSEWQSLKALKSELAERQDRVKERGKQVSSKLKESEEARQQLQLQLRTLQRRSARLEEELALSQQTLANERRQAARLEAKLEDEETMVALLSAEEPAPEQPASATAAPDVSATPEERANDDLQRIRGIGPVLHRKLNQIGVTSFRQIASWTDDDVVEVARRIGSGAGRIRKSGWIETARELQGG